jgi:hypothetical protein
MLFFDEDKMVFVKINDPIMKRLFTEIGDRKGLLFFIPNIDAVRYHLFFQYYPL